MDMSEPLGFPHSSHRKYPDVFHIHRKPLRIGRRRAGEATQRRGNAQVDATVDHTVGLDHTQRLAVEAENDLVTRPQRGGEYRKAAAQRPRRNTARRVRRKPAFCILVIGLLSFGSQAARRRAAAGALNSTSLATSAGISITKECLIRRRVAAFGRSPAEKQAVRAFALITIPTGPPMP
jgi:hypothetical protein